MSQSRTTCPKCQRAPGDVHPGGCPRSRGRLAALAFELDKPPRLIWKKGFLAYRVPNRFFPGTSIRSTENPGVPRTTCGNPRAGGIPAGKREEAAAFLQALGLEPTP